MSAPTFSSWTRSLTARGYGVLPSSHAVPVSLWLREPGGGRVLHFAARGTALRLRAYAAGELTTLILRAECDCEEHRTAGGTGRLVLAPHARPLEEHVLDGAATFGWTGHHAALLSIAVTAGILETLLAALSPAATGADRAERAVAS